MRKRTLIAAVSAAGALVGIGGVAQAGEWRLDPWRCPDLREDILDERVDHGWRDRREDRIDRQYTDCPASAWVYVGDRYDRYGRYDRNYRAGPPRYRDITYRGGYLVGTVGDVRFRIALTDDDWFQRNYRYSDRYRYNTRHHYIERSHDRYARRDDRRDHRYDRREDRHDDRYARRDGRRDDHYDQRRDRRDDRNERREDRNDRREDRRDDRAKGRAYGFDQKDGPVKGKPAH